MEELKYFEKTEHIYKFKSTRRIQRADGTIEKDLKEILPKLKHFKFEFESENKMVKLITLKA
jgi:hypothetical protein